MINAKKLVQEYFHIDFNQKFRIRLLNSNKYLNKEIYVFTEDGLSCLNDSDVNANKFTDDVLTALIFHSDLIGIEPLSDPTEVGSTYYYVDWVRPDDIKISKKTNQGDYIDYANSILKNMFMDEQSAQKFKKGVHSLFSEQRF